MNYNQELRRQLIAWRHDLPPPLHNACYDFNDHILTTGACYFA